MAVAAVVEGEKYEAMGREINKDEAALGWERKAAFLLFPKTESEKQWQTAACSRCLPAPAPAPALTPWYERSPGAQIPTTTLRLPLLHKPPRLDESEEHLIRSARKGKENWKFGENRWR